MPRDDSHLSVRFAKTTDDLRAAQRLRYDVFVRELGSDGPLVDHENGLEVDRFDPHFEHLLLIDEARGGEVVGVYRLLTEDASKETGGFYSEGEYDLTPLKTSSRRLLELGRSCLSSEYRGGTGMFLLWTALAQYIEDSGFDVLFGTASFPGTELDPIAPALGLLHERHLAPDDLRARAIGENARPMNAVSPEEIDRVSAMKSVPALIKAYLRLGGFVGEGAYVDHEFNTVDVLLILDTARMNEAQRKIYTRGLS